MKSFEIFVCFLLLLLVNVGSIYAKDDLNCLVCHQYQGLVRLENGKLHSYYVDQAVFDQEVHAQLTCETCHDYIKQVPHLLSDLRPVDCSNLCHLKDNPKFDEDFSHEKIKTAYTASSHGSKQEDTPRCNHCHLQHQMTKLTQEDPLRLDALCASCHANDELMKKHNKSARPVATYSRDVHRQARYYGEKRAAYCVKCHNPHTVLNYTNPDSPTHPANRLKICAQLECHPKATPTFASKGAIHNTYSGLMNLTVTYLPPIYVLIILGTIGFMLLHNGLDFLSYVIHGREVHAPVPKEARRFYVRLTLNERLQHLVLLIGFITLALTGFMLKIPREWILRFTPNIEYVYTIRWYLHRLAAVSLVAVSVYHLLYLALTKRGHYQFQELIPAWKDLSDIIGMGKYYLGLSKTKPYFEHFDYKEKIEYWALIWGNFVMILTGSLIWFKIYVPKAAVDVAFIVHHYEAILAVLAILVWHFYAVHWKPGKFPMSMIWLDGKISEEHLIEEHAAEYVKLTGQPLPEHHVLHSRVGSVSALIAILVVGLIVGLNWSSLKNSVTRKMGNNIYQGKVYPQVEDLSPSQCQKCHGSYPHEKNLRLRAFANMHTAQFYCEVCHISLKENSRKITYGWYNGSNVLNQGVPLTGKEALVTYPATAEKKEPLLMQENQFPASWRLTKGTACQVCHYNEGEPKIDFAALGYDEARIFNLTNSKALGMLIKREVFYFYAFD